MSGPNKIEFFKHSADECSAKHIDNRGDHENRVVSAPDEECGGPQLPVCRG